jgi:hypothetical protein
LRERVDRRVAGVGAAADALDDVFLGLDLDAAHSELPARRAQIGE